MTPDWTKLSVPSINTAFARLFPQPETAAGEVDLIYEVVTEYPTWCVDTASPVLIRSAITDGTFLS